MHDVWIVIGDFDQRGTEEAGIAVLTSPTCRRNCPTVARTYVDGRDHRDIGDRRDCQSWLSLNPCNQWRASCRQVPAAKLAVASAAGMMATGATFVVISALITAKYSAIPLDGLVYTHDANAVATCALDHLYCSTHWLISGFLCYRYHDAYISKCSPPNNKLESPI